MANPIDELLNALDWEELPDPVEPPPDGVHYATHAGVLRLGAVELRVYRLSNGNRVIDGDDLRNFLEGSVRGQSGKE